jgi:hypothetical protein
MLKEALTKLQAEITASPKKQYLAVIGAYMMDRVRNHPEDVEKVMAEGKTLAGSLSAMKEEARKNQSDGCGFMTDEQGFAIVLKYYGVNVPSGAPDPVVAAVPAISATIDDLF